MKKIFSFALLCILVAGAAFASGSQGPAAAGASTGTTIKVLFRGAKADGFDGVYAEFLRRTKDSLNINLDITFVQTADYKDKLNLEITSGTEYDLVFEAPWLLLRTLAADGYYADLSPYFNNNAYPGLKKAFTPAVMESNLWYGRMCYIPLYRAYGTGVPAVHYRQDWADAWGIGQIDSYDKLVKYWDAAKSKGILPLAVTSSRGFYQLEPVPHPGTTGKAAVDAGVMYITAVIPFAIYMKNGQVQAVAARGSGDAAFKDFPAPFNRDMYTDRLEVFAEWNNKGYISPDSLTITDEKTPFWAGQAASIIGTLDDVENNARNIPQYSPEAVIGEFIYNDDIRNLQPGAISASLASNNGLCVPDNSKNKDTVMRFLDWLFGSQENHDLFELGVQGKDYSLNSDGTYKALSTYPANWPGYGFTWNPNYVTYSEYFAGPIRQYRDYERKDSSVTLPPLTGFSFDASDVNIASYVAQVRAVYGKVERTQLHGILSDGTRTFTSAKAMMNTIMAECFSAGLTQIQAELKKQVQAFLDAKK